MSNELVKASPVSPPPLMCRSLSVGANFDGQGSLITITLGASLNDTSRAAIFSVSLFPFRSGQGRDFESGASAISLALG